MSVTSTLFGVLACRDLPLPRLIKRFAPLQVIQAASASPGSASHECHRYGGAFLCGPHWQCADRQHHPLHSQDGVHRLQQPGGLWYLTPPTPPPHSQHHSKNHTPQRTSRECLADGSTHNWKLVLVLFQNGIWCCSSLSTFQIDGHLWPIS